jgi:hypothetical protein
MVGALVLLLFAIALGLIVLELAVAGGVLGAFALSLLCVALVAQV